MSMKTLKNGMLDHVQGKRSDSGGLTIGSPGADQGAKFKPDAEIGHKIPFCIGLGILTIFLILFTSTAFAERLAVSSNTANIRSGPGTNYDILWKIEKYHPLFILKKNNAWYHFRDFEDDEGWIHESLVNKTPTVITKSEICNVRSGPGTKNKILFTVDMGIPFKILKKRGKWIHIQHADGDKGWIHKSLVW